LFRLLIFRTRSSARYVDSAAAVALTTKAFDEMKRDPRLGRAEALRRSMQALIASGGRFAHSAN
jgi:hypothetical protein